MIDKSGKSSEFEDTTNVEKYEMSEADYAQRSGTACSALYLWHF